MRDDSQLARLLAAALAGELSEGGLYLAGANHRAPERFRPMLRNGRNDWEDQAAEFDAYTERRAKEVEDRLTKALEDAQRQVEQILKAKPGGWTLADYEGLAAAVENAMRREGFDQLRADVIALVDDFSEKYLELTGDQLSDSALEAAREGMKLKTVWMSKLPADVVEALGQGLSVADRVPVSVDELGRELESVYGGAKAEQYAEALDQLIRQGKQKLLNALAEDLGLDAAFYFGPPATDTVIRPFCEHMVDRGYTREMLLGCDNGMLPNVLETRGGYGCRHTLIWTTVVDLQLVRPGAMVLGPWEYRYETIAPANVKTGRPARVIRYVFDLAPPAL